MQAVTVPGAVPRSVAVVGNAPELADQSGSIDAADWVVRFNNAAGFDGPAGCRVTHLALVNHGGQMREWLDDPGFAGRPVVRAARHVIFPFARKVETPEHQDADGRDWTEEAEARLKPLGATISILPDPIRREAGQILRPSHRKAVPSTGFLVVLHLLRSLPPSVTIDVHGFGFEGWGGHAFATERRWFERQRDAGRLRLHALDARLCA